MSAPDSSVLVAGYLPNHRFHDAAAPALGEVLREGRLLGHTMAETYAVLTASPYQAPADTVTAYLERFLRHEPAWLDGSAYVRALDELRRAGIEGGAVYDGLIGVAARNAGEELVSLDRRAARTYTRLGVEFRLLC